MLWIACFFNKWKSFVLICIYICICYKSDRIMASHLHVICIIFRLNSSTFLTISSFTFTHKWSFAKDASIYMNLVLSPYVFHFVFLSFCLFLFLCLSGGMCTVLHSRKKQKISKIKSVFDDADNLVQFLWLHSLIYLYVWKI